MIRLNNNYCIDADANSFKLLESSVKMNDETKQQVEVLKPVGYYADFRSALKAYKNRVLADEIQKKDWALHEVIQILDKLDEEINAYD